MRILVTGVGGQLGSEICRLSNHDNYGTFLNTSDTISGTKFVRLDITNRNKFLDLAQKIKPDWILHCAALTNVDLCEEQKELAWSVNVDGTKNAVDASRLVKCKLLYISTDYVFDGRLGFYKEDDIPNPLNYYGKTKFEGEKIVQNLGNIIIRSSVIYSKKKNNFVSWVIDSLKKGVAKVVTDQINSPTLNTELAECVLELINRDIDGIFHVAGDDRISRYDFAKDIAEVFDLDGSMIEPIKTEQLNQKAPRPIDSSLDTSKIKTLGIKLSNVNNGLKKLKEQIEGTD